MPMPKNVTRHLKAPKGGESTGGMRMADDWDKTGRIDPMKTRREEEAVKKAADKDVAAGRVTTKSRKKDQSRLMPSRPSIGGYMAGDDWAPGSPKPKGR